MEYNFKGNFGKLELIVDDKGIAMGKFQKDGTLEGTYIDNTFTGKWANKGLSGLVTFMVNDGKLEGNWKKGEEAGPMKGKWKGEEALTGQPNSTLNSKLNEEKDNLYETALKLTISNECISVSLIQNKLKIGANRSRRIIDQLKDAGIIEQAPIGGTETSQLYSLSDEHKTPLKQDCSDKEMKALFIEARELVISKQMATSSLLQRELKIGYNLAAQLIDQLEAARIISPLEGKARTLLVDSFKSQEQTLEENMPKKKAEDVLDSKFVSLQTELVQLYDDEEYHAVIEKFEQEEELASNNEKIMNCYLWSLYMKEEKADKCYEMIKHYEDKFKPDRWLKLKGHCYGRFKWHDYALKAYKDSNSSIGLEETQKIFDDFSDLIDQEKWEDAISYFEENLYLSVSENHLDVGVNYCRALYRSSESNEVKAWEELKKYIKRYPEHRPFLNIAGLVANFLVQYEEDFGLLDEAASFYKKAGNKEGVLAVKESIEKVKLAKREKAAAEKVREKSLAKQEAAAEKLKQHKFKSSKGQTFCQFCAKDFSMSSYDCSGRKHGHNYVLMKVDGSFKPTCNKCGSGYNFSEYSCS